MKYVCVCVCVCVCVYVNMWPYMSMHLVDSCLKKPAAPYEMLGN